MRFLKCFEISHKNNENAWHCFLLRQKSTLEEFGTHYPTIEFAYSTIYDVEYMLKSQLTTCSSGMLGALHKNILCTFYRPFFPIKFNKQLFPRLFKNLRILLIYGNVMELVLSEPDLTLHTIRSITIYHMACKTLSKFHKKKHVSFPNLVEVGITMTESIGNENELKLLESMGNIIKFLWLQNFKMTPFSESIQHLTSAQTIVLQCREPLSNPITSQKPDRQLLRLTYLQIYAEKIDVTYQHFVTLLSACPNIKICCLVFLAISEFCQEKFIAELDRKNIGQRMEDFYLILPKNKVIGDSEIIKAMLRNWPMIRTIGNLTWCKMIHSSEVTELDKFKRYLGRQGMINWQY